MRRSVQRAADQRQGVTRSGHPNPGWCPDPTASSDPTRRSEPSAPIRHDRPQAMSASIDPGRFATRVATRLAPYRGRFDGLATC